MREEGGSRAKRPDDDGVRKRCTELPALNNICPLYIEHNI